MRLDFVQIGPRFAPQGIRKTAGISRYIEDFVDEYGAKMGPSWAKDKCICFLTDP